MSRNAAGVDALLGGADDVVDEGPDATAQLLELGGQAEVDRHRRDSTDTRVWAVPRRYGLTSSHAGHRAGGRVLGDDGGLACGGATTTVLWARNPEVAEEVDTERTNDGVPPRVPPRPS